MSDSAHAYAAVDHPGIVEKHTVNHSEKVWSRPCIITLNTFTGEKVASRAHSQTIDRNWGLVKEQLPRYRSARTEEERTVLDEHIRAAQWRMQHSTYDLWEAFCKIAGPFAQQTIGKLLVEPHYHALPEAAPLQTSETLAQGQLQETTCENKVIH
jgi:hypothetical protein